MSNLVLKAQIEGNKLTGFGASEDGIYGPETRKLVIAVIQWAMNQDYGAGLDVDGIWGSLSEEAFGSHYVEVGETQYMVTALQIGLLAHGYDCNGVEVPGQFGDGCKSAVMAFQGDNGLSVDGIAGYATFHQLFDNQTYGGVSGGGYDSGEWTKYDPNNLPNFGPDEFKCESGCGGDVKDELKCKMQLLRDKICDYFGMDVPINITSGFRCAYQNEIDGGVPDSLHTHGEACDMYLGNITMEANVIDTIRELAHEVGLKTGNYYSSRFVHCQIGGSDFYGD